MISPHSDHSFSIMCGFLLVFLNVEDIVHEQCYTDQLWKWDSSISDACVDGPYSAGHVQYGISPNMDMHRRHKTGPSVTSNQLDSYFLPACIQELLYWVLVVQIYQVLTPRGTPHSISSLISPYDSQHLQKEPTESYVSSRYLNQGRNRRLSWWE